MTTLLCTFRNEVRTSDIPFCLEFFCSCFGIHYKFIFKLSPIPLSVSFYNCEFSVFVLKKHRRHLLRSFWTFYTHHVKRLRIFTISLCSSLIVKNKYNRFIKILLLSLSNSSLFFFRLRF